MRSFQGGRPSIYTLTDAIRKVPTPTLIICGDEDDNCVGPSLFLKQHLPAAGLSFFPKSGHVLNLEEPALFNEMVERFVALVEAGRWPAPDGRGEALTAPSRPGSAKTRPARRTCSRTTRAR
jgi:proline iminopeptidase